MNGLLIYLIIVNFVSGIIFSLDKYLATKKKRRISESMLHTLEFFGGAFLNLVLIFTIRHKNKKPKYYAYTFILTIVWIYLYIVNL